MRGSRTCIALVVAVGLAGCGSADHHAGLTSRQQDALVAQLEAARGSAAARDVAGTTTAIARFRDSVARLRRSGALSDARARSLRIGAARVLARVEDDNAAPTQSAPAPQATTTPAPPPRAQKKKHDKHGKPKGEKKHGKDK